MEGFRRRTPEELLYTIFQLQKGRLKIYIGAVSGSGKTYHMLREGQALKRQGIDVVLCAVSTMQRPETARQLEGLERIPSIHWMKGDAEKKDLNLEALLQRNPEVVLVDGLAHRNREGAAHATRLEDIKALLNAGISVITTVNVYELEGATELARKLTGIEIKETVPNDTLELADEVRLIDATPEAILERISAGHMKASYRSLYERGNLGKLRELALRLVAEGVNETLEKHREENGLLGPSGAAERILVSVQYHWNGSIYVRRGQQIAKRLGGDLRIVSFVNPRVQLSNEAAAFKRSIIQLTAKVDGQFEEIPLSRRRMLPRELVHYAARNGVSRIVMGHSKMSAWQEWRKGSVVNGLLKRIRNVDLFFVADRADREGERILPTKSKREKETERYRRLSSLEVEEQIRKIRRGKFKVYIGAAPGVGKTYTMLREGNDLLKRGIDVVIGLLETHGRQETVAQIGELTVIPRKATSYRGSVLEEMDLEAILARNPEVVLVDELAHTNVPGSANSKRYEDVLELLNAGISVISTMNVQHLESLNDSVEQITGIRVRETVPDRMLRLADEVQLIDVAPSSLRQRMKEGQIYELGKVDQALRSFFKTGNLIALRELALREIADDVDERLESWERGGSLRGPWRRQETICVAITLSSNAERLIRRGFRIAHRLKAAWYVTFVQPGHQSEEETRLRLEKLLELTVRLGGKFEVQRAEHGKSIAGLLIAKADEYGGTQIIVGQSGRGFWHRLRHGNVVRTILRRARHMDVLVVADYDRHARLIEE
ncbi:universal stress protein [Cohnella sp. AR92]|uniref:universal stress protein n=1 Tax=Cohnella sp. AR92 TaxID=648716 RepID=UPI000F8EFCAE|nr:universal stress protein [Cohnella sp. AR92]RUS45820.1 histidine kinase [Cohnella sp. AR92]